MLSTFVRAATRSLRFPAAGILAAALLVAASAQESSRRESAHASTAAPAPGRFELDDGNFAAWRAHLQPRPAELAWLRIPWLTTLGDGIVRADAQTKPLLLWVMNGHPLGCT
ncbi:MAG: hypothetical protein IH986_12905 [Planctomycetes bacterium]|nr:hypothetical protein [Planctomycetota bacterium]